MTRDSAQSRKGKPESQLHSWWRTVVVPAMLEGPLHDLNRAMIEQSTVELRGATLLVRGGELPIASGVVGLLIITTVDRWPPPAPLQARTVEFVGTSWGSWPLGAAYARG